MNMKIMKSKLYADIVILKKSVICMSSTISNILSMCIIIKNR